MGCLLIELFCLLVACLAGFNFWVLLIGLFAKLVVLSCRLLVLFWLLFAYLVVLLNCYCFLFVCFMGCGVVIWFFLFVSWGFVRWSCLCLRDVLLIWVDCVVLACCGGTCVALLAGVFDFVDFFVV